MTDPFSDRKWEPFEVGPFEVFPYDPPYRVSDGTTNNRKASAGRLYLFEATTSEGAVIEVHYALWENGERDVRPHFAEGGGVPFSRLNCGRLRLGVQPNPEKSVAHRGRYHALLQCAEVPPDRDLRPGMRTVTVPELNDAAGCDVEAELMRSGARACGAREDVYGETNQYRRWPCVVFDGDDPRPPVAAFLLTRALPLLRAA